MAESEVEPCRWTATQALKQIKSNHLSVEDYATSLLSRIRSRDCIVNAWAYLDADHVLEQARRLDRLPATERGPLHGLAVGVKDVIYTKDMPTQHNSPIYHEDAPQVDAASVAILRKAGALIFGKTATTEFAATTKGPKTCNPHDPSRTPGGSSSGSGAAVADMQVPLALGTQTGGSTIRPGSYNGIYAMKPTWNAISREGQKIYSLILDTLGLYARSVEDLQLLAEVFALKDDDGESKDDLHSSLRQDESPLALHGAKFAFVKTMVWPQVGQGTADAMGQAMLLLQAHGATVEEVTLPSEFGELPKWHRTVLMSEGRVSFLPEYRRAKDLLSPYLIDQVENVAGYSRKEQLEAFDGIASLRPKIDDILGQYAAIVTPSVPDEAPSGIEKTGSAAFNSIWTALHTPVINVPGFQGANGMPIGLSLVGPRYRDQFLLKVCREVGKIFESEGGWTSKL